MKFKQKISVEEIAKLIGAEIKGRKDLNVLGMNEIHKVEKGDLTFVDNHKYFQRSLDSSASVIIINEDVKCPRGKALLIHKSPFTVYNKLAKKFQPKRILDRDQAKDAQIHPTAIIEPNVVIGHNVTIGRDTYIQANSYIGNDTVIGDGVEIHAGTTIGTDAFYFHKSAKKYTKWYSIGRVVIENKVVIGANCTINRGVSGDTVIGEGSKLDSQVHLGHGVVIGKHCLIAGQVGIGGKTILEDHVVLFGQVGIAQNLRIGRGAIIAAKSGVSKDLAGGLTYFGTPAAEIKTKHRELAALRHLPDFYKDYYK